MVDFPELFGPTSKLMCRSATLKFLNVLKFLKWIDVIVAWAGGNVRCIILGMRHH